MPKLKENNSTLKKVLGRIARYRLNAVLSILLSAVYVGLRCMCLYWRGGR